MEPNRPTPPPQQTSTSAPHPSPVGAREEPQTPIPQAIESALHEKPKKRRKTLYIVLSALLALVLFFCGAGYVWYQSQLSSPNPESKETARVVVEAGSTSSIVAADLAEQGVIKSRLAFEVYYRLHSAAGLKAGTYVIEKRSSVSEIVAHLEEGKSDEFSLTFLPGATLNDAKKVLQDAGYTDAEINTAVTKDYDHPLLEDKPTGVDIEGYVYGDTYSFMAGSSVEQIFERIFDHMYEDVQSENLVEEYAARGMTLYEAITFASIVQAEVSNVDDMAHVSQVFHSRLDMGMQLGSDVTFIYGARKLGVAPTVDLDSPYNTRVRTGLPPGPVSNPGLNALIAGANPTNTDDIFFVAGDDGVTYFSRTLEEHERLTREHCMQNCILPSE